MVVETFNKKQLWCNMPPTLYLKSRGNKTICNPKKSDDISLVVCRHCKCLCIALCCLTCCPTRKINCYVQEHDPKISNSKTSIMLAPMLGSHFLAHDEPCKFCPNIRSPFGFLPMKKQPEHRKIGESQALSTALHVMTLTVRQWGRAKHVVSKTRWYPLPETNSSHLKRCHPIKKIHLPSSNFQVRKCCFEGR